MARAKRTIDKEEVDEIIYLKLKELGGMKKRLTYNSVFTFNKEIANNPKIVTLPGTPEFVEGLITIRGKFYTVVNLKNFLGLKQQEYKHKKNIIIVNSEEFQVGFIVDEIFEIFELTEEEVTNNQFLNAAPFIFNEIVKNEKIYTILDMPDILNSDKILIDEKETSF